MLRRSVIASLPLWCVVALGPGIDPSGHEDGVIAAARTPAESGSRTWLALGSPTPTPTDTEAETESTTKPEPTAACKAEPEPKPEPKTKPEAKAKAKTKSEAEAKTKPEAKAKTKPETETETEPSSGGRTNRGRRGLSWGLSDQTPLDRRFILGIEGVVIQAPPLRPDIVRFDPRFIGRSVSLAGLGLVARMRLHPRIGIEAVVRSGSVRYASREGENDDVVSQDQVMADLGVLLFVAQGEIAQLAFDAGLGGMGTRISYELEREGTQLFGSGLVRVGADAEFLVKRIAFVVSGRAYGVFTDRDRVRNRGDLLDGTTARSPVPALQTYLVGSGGIAYRF